MSKTYFGRCAAVGIAGLTAMSSIAIVASAATQTSSIYELSYKGLTNIGMVNTAGYATGTNEYCTGTTTKMGDGFAVDLAKLLATTTTYTEKSYDSITKKTTSATATITAADVWGTDAFDDVEFATGGTWKYQEFDDTYALADAKLGELYTDRGTGLDFEFKTESERNEAKASISSKIKNEYNTLAGNACKRFNADIDAAKNAALKAIDLKYESDMATANTLTGTEKSVATSNASAKRSAAKNAVNTSATKIKNEFKSAFTASNFRIDSDGFAEKTYAVVFGQTFAGVTTSATYNGQDLAGAKYYAVSTKYVNDASYAFKGEIQLKANYIDTNVNGLCINGNDWLNFEVINYNTNSGGNTTPEGNKDNTKDDTKKDTTTTNWYPSSASYRAASEVSYLGENGSWYTSSSAASVYGGGYTGTSKNSNFSAVNSAADGKAIYFNSTTGTYSTSSSTYSYVVKEATTTTTDTNDDPYYSYFFNGGNKNNNTTTSVPAGSPAISGASKYAGWTNIYAYITNRAKSGATYTINMNDGTVVPAAVLAAAKAKNVTLVFANDNGSKVTVKPGKVSTTSDLNVAVTYNVKDVKSSLVKKAKKVNKGTVSTAQVRIGTDGSIGGTETVTVKFSKKRSGCTVKAYRLTESGSLKKEASGTVASTGRANLNLTKGGSYLLVVIDD